MGREEPGDFHPIINEWGGEWVVTEPGEVVSLPGSSDLKARGRSWACHCLALLSQGEELSRLPYININ
jgi:hypothetical protein